MGRPDLNVDVHVLIVVIMFKVGTSAPGPDGLHFAHLQPSLAAAFDNGNGTKVINRWRHVVEGSKALPPDF